MVSVVEGDTEPLEFDVQRAPTPGATQVTFNAEGMTITATIKARDRTTAVDTAGKVEWADAQNSRMRFNRAAGDFLKSKSPYYLHAHVSDGIHTVSWPEGAGLEIVVKARGEG